MSKVLHFKTCAKGGEYLGLGTNTPNTFAISKPANTEQEFQVQINNEYSGVDGLDGKVIAVGYGWQKFVVPSTGNAKISVRGAAGGCVSYPGFAINNVTGACSGSGHRGGRGAKVEGMCKLKKGEILYLLVGIRGGCTGWGSAGGSWGSGGGGASVILRENPSGQYTFAPMNKKVDVLFVAGGGGGAADADSVSTSRYGKDADYKNGSNTLGGSCSGASGGSGLTGNSNGGGSSGYVSYNLLSGTANPNAVFQYSYTGGWGGGGYPWNGGGGGGGYSGGNASESVSYGGTSYINPTHVQETFRGYADIVTDASRGLTNPWINCGHIEIVLGRSEDKYILAQDSEGFKWFNGTEYTDGTINPNGTNEWELLPIQDESEIEYSVYKQYGNRVITGKLGLQDETTFWVNSTEAEEFISISGYINQVLIEQATDISLSDVSIITKVEAKYDTSNLDIRFAMSRDHGKTWYTYDPNNVDPKTGSWKTIDIHNKADFSTYGFPLNQFSTIPLTEWNRSKPTLIRFAYIVTQNGPNGNAIISNAQIVCDLLGSWRHFTESEAMYEYISDSEIKVTFKEPGNYKVNYLDSIS